jgi:hypothetical protein
LRKNDETQQGGKRTFCPVNEIDWDEIFNQHRPGNDEPDPEGELLPQDLMIKRYTAGYPDEARKNWIERRLRAWWQTKESEDETNGRQRWEAGAGSTRMGP